MLKKTMKKYFFNEIRDTKGSLIWLLTQRLGILKIMSKTISFHLRGRLITLTTLTLQHLQPLFVCYSLFLYVCNLDTLPLYVCY